MAKLVPGYLSKYLCVLLCVMPVVVQADVERIQLKSDALVVELTAAIGGRVLSVALHGQPNFLWVSDEVSKQPSPSVTPEAGHIGYMGHEVWVGPQSQWWQHQRVNRPRREANAVWPPDPFLVLSAYTLQEKNSQQVTMQSPASPVSGVMLQKHIALVDDNPNQIQLTASARNIRDTSVAWDIWFNTRVPHTTAVYVPVKQEKDIRIEQLGDDQFGPVTGAFDRGLWSLDNHASPTHEGRKGKVFIQPSHGWLAAFRGQQLLIIQFPLQEKTAIHPEQGQVELYQEFTNTDRYPDLANRYPGLLELEVHAPYKTLAPGETMQASEVWWLMPYSGKQEASAQRAFLRTLPTLWE